MRIKYILSHPIHYQVPLIKYLKKKGIKTIERDTDPETGKVLDEPIEIPLAKATKEEIQEEYTATKEIVGEEIEYKKG